MKGRRVNTSNVVKSKDLKGPLGIDNIPVYDFSINIDESNIVSTEASKDFPTIEEEIERNKIIKDLSNLLDKCLLKELNIEPVPTAFSRWLFIQLSTTEPTTSDPILKRPELALETKVIRERIEDSFPKSSYIPWSSRDNLQKISLIINSWISSLKLYIEKIESSKSYRVSDEMRTQIKTQLQTQKQNQTIKKPVKTSNKTKSIEKITSNLKKAISDFEEYFESLNNPKPEHVLVKFNDFKINRFLPGIRVLIEDKLKQILDKLVTTAKNKVNELRLNYQLKSKVGQIRHIRVKKEDYFYTLEYNKTKVSISILHYDKLKKLWNLNKDNRHHTVPEDFHSALFVILLRYQTLFGDIEREKSLEFHAASPETYFDYITKTFNVGFECFASPFNCYYCNFCSAFVDTDSPFGSRGSFFYLKVKGGFYEVNPPYVEEVMDYMVDHLENLLEKSEKFKVKKPLSFLVGVPDWRKPLQPAQQKMESSRFLTYDFVIEGNKHAYVTGGQHIKQRNLILLPFKIHFYVLQNELAKKNERFNEEQENEIKEAFEKSSINVEEKQGFIKKQKEYKKKFLRPVEYKGGYKSNKESEESEITKESKESESTKESKESEESESTKESKESEESESTKESEKIQESK